MNFEKCRKCANAGHTYVCSQCGGRFNHFEPIKPKTNADHIRAMTDEELAEFLEGDFGNMMTNTALRWLKQPYKEDA